MTDKERLIKGYFNRLNDLNDQKNMYQKCQDHTQAAKASIRMISIRKQLKKEMSL